MCGIAGILNLSVSRDELADRLLAVQKCLVHRGPDDRGIYVAPEGGVGLVHTRLAILDLSPAGHQPMADPTGRFVITFNGEIYNFQALRDELEAAGESFQSRSDTEVILKMYQRYGPNCVREMKGMFAFAIWDKVERTCFIARDPFGIKPLYYHSLGGVFTFASEIRALLGFNHVPRRISSPAIHGYLLFGSVPEPETIIDGVRCLPAGHYLLWREGRFRVQKYWDVQFSPENIAPADAIQTVRTALLDSVRRHFVSDVPVGIFLSGGIDSTALVALARKVRQSDLRTFCISFDDPTFNEGDLAARTAEHFGTKHEDWRLNAAEGRRLLQEFLDHSDQPSIDGFNTYCVSKHAHRHGAKVVLSGLGGDELFGGYPSFSRVPRLVGTNRWASLLGPLKQAAARGLGYATSAARLQRVASYLAGFPSTAGGYWCVRGIFTPREAHAIAAQYDTVGEVERSELHFGIPAQPTIEDEVSYLELTRYMRNQLLRDSDVMSMSVGLELRVPYVDRKLMETLARIPAELRLAPGKQMLVNAVPEIPEWVFKHPKRGFSFPFDQWMLEEWSDVFRKIDAESPVVLKTWYRRWCVFALENFLRKVGVR